jgi:hypothetical protein
VAEAIAAADPGVAELIARLATDEVDSQPFDAVRLMLLARAQHDVHGLTAQIGANPDDAELLRLQHWLTQITNQLRDPDTAPGAAEQLVAWLGSRGEEGT